VGYKKARHHHDFHHPFVEIYLASDEVVLQSVVVEAESSRTDLNSTSSQVLTSKELDAVASESLADAASQISGVNTISTGQNVVKPIIHGLHSNRILILNNGLRHEFQNWGIDHAPEIDPSLIDRLEVVKGAATVRFGPDALGGAILIQPPAMKLSTPLQGKVNLVGKSNGRSYESTLELKKGFKWWSVLAGGSFVNQGDLQAPDYNLSNTGKEERSYYGGFRIHPYPR
jgi:iron complex outermembrane receptor protein